MLINPHTGSAWSPGYFIVLLIAGAVLVLLLGSIVAYFSIGLLALAARDYFKDKEYRNGCEAVFLALMLFVFAPVS